MTFPLSSQEYNLPGLLPGASIVLYEQDCKDLSDNFEEFINVSDNRTERLTEINKGFISNIKKLLDKSNEKKLQMEIEKLQEKMLEDVETAKNEMHHLHRGPPCKQGVPTPYLGGPLPSLPHAADRHTVTV